MDFAQQLIDAIPAMIFVVDPDANILHTNRSAAETFARDGKVILHRLCGDAIECMNIKESGKSCGSTPGCDDCVIRKAVAASAQRQITVRHKCSMRLQVEGESRQATFLISTAPFPGREPQVILTIEDITELDELRSLWPICMHCKRIRNDQEFWESVESYFLRHTNLRLTHGLCPDCLEKMYPNEK